jgi:hypothetical protein
MERPGDEPPDGDPRVIETYEPERPDGRRIGMCAVLFLAGAACIAAAFVTATNEAVQIIAVLGGIVMMLIAFLGAMGSKGVHVEATEDGVKIDGQIPVGYTKTLKVSPSLLTGRVPPKEGIMPPVSGHMPPKVQESPRGPDESDEAVEPSSESTPRDRGHPEEESAPDHPTSAGP